jgi:hypothetical protein
MISIPDRREDSERNDDRRDSPRVPIRLWARDLAEGGIFQVHHADIGVGGAFWTTRYPPLGTQVEIGFRLADQKRELRAAAKIVRTTSNGEEIGLHVLFTDLDVRAELALARYVESKARESMMGT